MTSLLKLRSTWSKPAGLSGNCPLNQSRLLPWEIFFWGKVQERGPFYPPGIYLALGPSLFGTLLPSHKYFALATVLKYTYSYILREVFF